jgi:hypothetical protein
LLPHFSGEQATKRQLKEYKERVVLIGSIANDAGFSSGRPFRPATMPGPYEVQFPFGAGGSGELHFAAKLIMT